MSGTMRWFGGLIAAAWLTVLAPSGVLAQDQAEDAAEQNADTPDNEDRASAFRAVSGPQTEQVPGGKLLIAAYGIAWVLILLFLWRMQKMHVATKKETARLAELLKESPYRGKA